MRVLVLNAGSSSLKASVVDDGETLLQTSVSWGGDATRALDRPVAVQDVLQAFEAAGITLASVEAVGHRVVHGGGVFAAPIVLDDGVVEALDDLSELAPLHNIIAVETIRAARGALSRVPHVACFDTAFHAALPESVVRYALPESWYTDWGIRRYGFHGLSVTWAIERAGVLLGRAPNELDIVVAHLGSGCSVTAVRGGRSVATSMGFTPLEGLMMGTRAGSIDPGIVLHLLKTGRISIDGLADILEHRSGLLGVSGQSADIRELEASADAGDDRARLALDMFVDRAAAGIGAATVALQRLDALVFTGGIGQNAERVRSSIVERLAVFGFRPLRLDETGMDRVLAVEGLVGAGDVDKPLALMIEAREDLVIARAVSTLVAPR